MGAESLGHISGVWRKEKVCAWGGGQLQDPLSNPLTTEELWDMRVAFLGMYFRAGGMQWDILPRERAEPRKGAVQLQSLFRRCPGKGWVLLPCHVMGGGGGRDERYSTGGKGGKSQAVRREVNNKEVKLNMCASPWLWVWIPWMEHTGPRCTDKKSLVSPLLLLLTWSHTTLCYNQYPNHYKS